MTGQTAWFDGICFGWRVAPIAKAIAEGLERGPTLDCEPTLYGDTFDATGRPIDSQSSDIDVTFVTIPADARIKHTDRWACGSTGISDHLVLRLAGGEDVDISRAMTSERLLEFDALEGAVAMCQISAKPAVCIQSEADGVSVGSALSAVFVIEDDTLDPNAVVLRLYSDELELPQLQQIAESVRGYRAAGN